MTHLAVAGVADGKSVTQVLAEHGDKNAAKRANEALTQALAAMKAAK